MQDLVQIAESVFADIHDKITNKLIIESLLQNKSIDIEEAYFLNNLAAKIIHESSDQFIPEAEEIKARIEAAIEEASASKEINEAEGKVLVDPETGDQYIYDGSTGQLLPMDVEDAPVEEVPAEDEAPENDEEPAEDTEEPQADVEDSDVDVSASSCSTNESTESTKEEDTETVEEAAEVKEETTEAVEEVVEETTEVVEEAAETVEEATEAAEAVEEATEVKEETKIELTENELLVQKLLNTIKSV